jgi:hypothetical protein
MAAGRYEYLFWEDLMKINHIRSQYLFWEDGGFRLKYRVISGSWIL